MYSSTLYHFADFVLYGGVVCAACFLSWAQAVATKNIGLSDLTAMRIQCVAFLCRLAINPYIVKADNGTMQSGQYLSPCKAPASKFLMQCFY